MARIVQIVAFIMCLGCCANALGPRQGSTSRMKQPWQMNKSTANMSCNNSGFEPKTILGWGIVDFDLFDAKDFSTANDWVKHEPIDDEELARKQAPVTTAAASARPLLPEVAPGAWMRLTPMVVRVLLIQAVVFILTFIAVRWTWPQHKDPWGLADLFISLVLYPIMFWTACQGMLETRHAVEMRWQSTTDATVFFQVLYITRSFLHCFIVTMQPLDPTFKLLSYLHHVLSIAAYSGSLLSGKLHFFGSLDGCCEITNVFLTILYLFKEVSVGGKPLQTIVPNWLYVSNGALLWLSFVFFRLLLFPCWLYSFYADIMVAPELTWDQASSYELYLYPSVNVFLLGLSITWFRPINRGLCKALWPNKNEGNGTSSSN